MGVVHHAPASGNQVASLAASVVNEIQKATTEIKNEIKYKNGKKTNEFSSSGQKFSEKYGVEKNGALLKVFVERQDTTFNIYWDNIEDFLIEECERLDNLFLRNPSIYSIKNCAPNS